MDGTESNSTPEKANASQPPKSTNEIERSWILFKNLLEKRRFCGFWTRSQNKFYLPIRLAYPWIQAQHFNNPSHEEEEPWPTMATFSRAVHSLPLLFAVSTCVTVIISYVLAVTSGQVYPFLPSISKTAAFEPQGSLFAQCLSIVSIIALLMISVRYLQLELLSKRLKERGQPCPWIKFNPIALLFGIACALALTMVASFRSGMEVRLLPMSEKLQEKSSKWGRRRWSNVGNSRAGRHKCRIYFSYSRALFVFWN